MKKIVKVLLSVFLITLLVGCSSDNVQENLQSNNWNVVSTTGEAYSASFGQDTLTFEMGSFRRGFSYLIEDDIITLEESDSDTEPLVFTIESNNNEYIFTAQTEEIQENYGNLTLSPND